MSLAIVVGYDSLDIEGQEWQREALANALAAVRGTGIPVGEGEVRTDNPAGAEQEDFGDITSEDVFALAEILESRVSGEGWEHVLHSLGVIGPDGILLPLSLAGAAGLAGDELDTIGSTVDLAAVVEELRDVELPAYAADAVHTLDAAAAASMESRLPLFIQ